MNGYAKFCKLFGWPEPVEIPGSNSLWVTTAEITPEVALELLTKHHIKRNRPKKGHAVRSYVMDMSSNRWKLNHQGLGFDRDCNMYDGQNRCYSSFESDSSFRTLIVFGGEDESKPTIDLGVKRSIRDAAAISGIDVQTRFGPIVRCVVFGSRPTCASSPTLLAAYQVVKEPVDFVFNEFPSHIKNVSIQPIYGALGRAWYHVPKEILERFTSVLRSDPEIQNGVPEKNARTLLRFLTSGWGSVSRGGTAVTEYYLKACSAIDASRRGVAVTKLYAKKKNELFALPKRVRKELLAIGIEVE